MFRLSKSVLITIPDKDLKWWEDFAKTARRESSVSAVLVEQAREYTKKHAESSNPQTTIQQFDRHEVTAIPNMYAILDADGPQKLDKFYSRLSKADYKELDAAMNVWWSKHNRHYSKMKGEDKW